MASKGTVTKMEIMAYKDRAFSSKVGTYKAMINPDKISLNRSIEYNTQQAPDKSEPSIKYNRTPASTLSFDLVIDCTGIVDTNRMELHEEIKKLQGLVYDFQGDIHRPYFITLNWGIGQNFKGVLSTFNTNYTLFNPDGDPIRATVSLSFTSYLDPKAVAKDENTQSPDMTHRISVVAGDTLPSLSQQVYDKPDYYVQLAQYNNLNKFRHIKPGSQLIFPPIVPDDSPVEAQS